MMAGEYLRRKRVENPPGLVESAVHERTHPACVYTLVDRIDRYEPSGMRALPYSLRILDDFDALGGDLKTILALPLAGDEDARVGHELVEEPAPAPDGRRSA